MKRESISIDEFLAASNAVWTEIKYQDALPRRTDDEAKDIPAFITLLRRYLRTAEDNWADNPGETQPDGKVQVPASLNDMRKLAAIAVRAMIYNGIRSRKE